MCFNISHRRLHCWRNCNSSESKLHVLRSVRLVRRLVLVQRSCLSICCPFFATCEAVCACAIEAQTPLLATEKLSDFFETVISWNVHRSVEGRAHDCASNKTYYIVSVDFCTPIV